MWRDLLRAMLPSPSLFSRLPYLALALLAVSLTSPAQSATDQPFIQPRGQAAAPTGAKGLCQTYDWACARGATRALSAQDQLRQIAAVNSRINHSVRSVDDRRQYGVDEYWALPTDVGGDCEDFALMKKRELVALGVQPARLLIATALDRQRNPHAVLVYRSDEGDLVLDNLTDQIRSWDETHYLFLLMQDPDRPTGWVTVYTSG